MADNNTENIQATEEQQDAGSAQATPVRGKMLDGDSVSDWGAETRIVEPTAKTEQNALRNEFETASNTEEDEKTEKAAEEADAQNTDETEEDEPAASAGSFAVEDPGDFQPADYSFEVTVYDQDGNKPKSIKVESIEEWEKLLESEPNLGSSVAVNRAFRAAQKMEDGLDRDYKEWEKKVGEYNEAVERANQVEARNSTIFNEMGYLMDKGDLPKLTREEMNDLDWSNPDVVKAHPNIKAHNELLSYMVKENKARSKAGLAPLSSVLDAFNAMQLDARRKGDIESRKAAGEARKAAGARVASGSSMPISAAQPRGIAVGRVGNLDNLGQNWNV